MRIKWGNVWKRATSWVVGHPRDPVVAEWFAPEDPSTGVVVNRKTALGHSPWWRGVNLISSSVGKLPLLVYRRLQGGGKDRAPEHPAYKLLRRKPCPEMSSMVFRETLEHHALCHGNGFAYILRNEDGIPLELWPLNPEPNTTFPVVEDNTLWYVTHINNQMRRLPPADVLHIRGLGFDGLVGYSVIDIARESLGLGLAARKHGAVFFKNNARPSFVLKHPGTLTEEAIKNLREGWSAVHGGLDNTMRPAILEEGMDLGTIGFNAKDAQFIETREMDVREVANWLGLPPHKLGDTTRTAYASLEQENQSFLDECLDAWLVKWEEECWNKLLTEAEKDTDAYTVEFLRSALVRANMDQRFAAYNVAINGGWMSRDEVRNLENMNPMPDGKGTVFLEPLNMQEAGAGSQAEPEQEEEEEDVPDRSLFRGVLEDAARQAYTRIGNEAVRAAGKPAKFLAWLDKLDDCKPALVAMVYPAARAVLIGTDISAEQRVDDLFAGVLGGIRAELLELYDTVTPSQFENHIKTVVDFHKRFGPVKLADLILKETTK